MWFKSSGGVPLTRCTVMSMDEEIYLIGGPFIKTMPGAPSVWTTGEHRPRYSAAIGHPNAKPIALMERLLSLLPENMSVADPFVGSGSTLIAARRQGRRAVGVESDEHYCEIAAGRLSQGDLIADLEGGVMPNYGWSK